MTALKKFQNITQFCYEILQGLYKLQKNELKKNKALSENFKNNFIL